jgi:hypothetical protein
MSRPSQSMNAPVRPTIAESTTITRYRTIDVDGLKLFYREAGAPEAPAPKEMQSDWRPCSPSVPVADDLSIPDFLKREPAAVSESPEGLLVAAE